MHTTTITTTKTVKVPLVGKVGGKNHTFRVGDIFSKSGCSWKITGKGRSGKLLAGSVFYGHGSEGTHSSTNYQPTEWDDKVLVWRGEGPVIEVETVSDAKVVVMHKFAVGDKMDWAMEKGVEVKGVFLNDLGQPCYEFVGHRQHSGDTVAYYDKNHEPLPKDPTVIYTITIEQARGGAWNVTVPEAVKQLVSQIESGGVSTITKAVVAYGGKDANWLDNTVIR